MDTPARRISNRWCKNYNKQ